MAQIDTSPIVRGAIWIRPTGEALRRIDEAIHVVRRRYEGPPVKPHVSLLGGVETTKEQVELKLRQLAHRLRPFEIRLGRIDWRPEYYRALFVTAELTDTLAQAHRLTAEIFERESADDFEPHVSLAYGDLQERLQSELARDIGDSIDVSFTASAIGMANSTSDRPITDWRVINEASFATR